MHKRGALTVGLVGCASLKLQCPAPARDLYVSQLFRKASAYAAATCDRWYILSAKHGGVVHPDTVLEAYDVRLGANQSAPPIHEWGAMVREQLTAELAGLENITIIARQAANTAPHCAACPGLSKSRCRAWALASNWAD